MARYIKDIDKIKTIIKYCLIEFKNKVNFVLRLYEDEVQIPDKDISFKVSKSKF